MTDAHVPGAVQVLPLPGLPEITAGTDLAAALALSLEAAGGLRDGDVLVVSSKLVSKALGLRVPEPVDRERVVADQSVRVVAERLTPAGLTQVVESVAGPVLAAGGVDASNTGPEGGLLLLPPDPDAAARELHDGVVRTLGAPVRAALLLTDTAGRPWRDGQTDLALGASGLRVLDDLRGGRDGDGRPLAVTSRAVADELAAAADLVKGKASGTGAALVRGLPDLVLGTPDAGSGPEGPTGARALVRTGPGDWFALGHREALRSALGAPPGTPAARRVGLPSVVPEDERQRAARAVRLALVGQPEDDVEVCLPDDLADGLSVTAPDPVLAGRVAARLEVALVAEDLHAGVSVLSRPPAG
ncbi:Coenzyme F420-0:L-glutamate ligase [Serinicoccus hydrothermalis]|uniref:Coenzyme F420-0:L-glutamate ligase n=1 Tax=Serinicoccus hydrothermalis TaxID=1758689 RepID=A0A1B1NAG3_9MICO|nr:coenzyme F420-0:L-glutamate ligase [Serinicoccus hydrothermalis]ANS78430.1 Coenzyme F420-0:L-glutamate ligase [Serinicoccus hydrothermalis]